MSRTKNRLSWNEPIISIEVVFFCLLHSDTSGHFSYCSYFVSQQNDSGHELQIVRPLTNHRRPPRRPPPPLPPLASCSNGSRVSPSHSRPSTQKKKKKRLQGLGLSDNAKEFWRQLRSSSLWSVLFRIIFLSRHLLVDEIIVHSHFPSHPKRAERIISWP